MKKLVICLILLVTVAISLGVYTSCGNDKPTGPLRSVLVLHSWDKSGEEDELFTEAMKEAFIREGINADIHHIYGNMVHNTIWAFKETEWGKYQDSIRKWKPEVILVNDDPMLTAVFRAKLDDSLFANTPVVFSGINILMRDSLYRYPLMTGFEDLIDLGRNLEVMMKVTHRSVAFIELDYDESDSLLRNDLFAQLADTSRYINNSDFHLMDLRANSVKNDFPGKAVVTFASSLRPETNCRPDDPPELGKFNTEAINEGASRLWMLQVKYDITSNSFITRSQCPQFTCIREQFNNGTETFLGGYFTSTETQVKDQVNYAAMILKGADPRQLPIALHKSDYFMDYKAMKKFKTELKYEKFVDKFNIVNAPYSFEHPTENALMICAGAALLCLVVTLVANILYTWRRRGQMKLYDDLKYEEKMHSLIFSSGEDTLWRSNGETVELSREYAAGHGLKKHILTLEEFYKMVHKDSLASLAILRDFRNQRGKKVLRFRLTFDGGKTWSWNEMIYTANPISSKTGVLYGIMLNVDKKKEIEDTLFEAQNKASEVALKENFLANISHDLRTPLNAITGFSMLLTNPDMTFEEGEREEYGKIIHQNTDMILSMIDSVMEKAQLETGDIELLLKPVSIDMLVHEAYMTNKIIAPGHLEFILEREENDCMVNIDTTRTLQVVNNFLSNAFKFTITGSITLGWHYLDDKDHIEVYVRDTGIGVSKEGQEKLFDRFFKENETDRGTGLGLNISKTIMEKQNGTIGVESELGKGSKFFFRLTRYVGCLILALCLGLSGTSCSHLTNKQQRLDKNVLVIHSFNRKHHAYRMFDENLRRELIKNGIQPSIGNVYLAQETPNITGRRELQNVVDSLAEQNWKPDLILLEGDRVINDISGYDVRKIIPNINHIPMVFGSIHHPDWDYLREFKNSVVFYDPIDYCSNINLAVQLTGKNVIEIELDYFRQDEELRKELKANIARPPYIDNTDMHIMDFSEKDLLTKYKDSVLIYSFSVHSPELNLPKGYTAVTPHALLKAVYANAWHYPQLSIKSDFYSEELVQKTGRPQFTAVKSSFAAGNGEYLAGYFASYETIAKDMAETGAKLLHGVKAKDLSGKRHEKHYYMDWQAMERLGLKYSDYSDRFIIVGAPARYSSPIEYWMGWTILGLFGSAVVVIWLSLITFWRERTDVMLLEDVQRNAHIRSLALNGAHTITLRSDNELEEVFNHLHHDYSDQLEFMKQSMGVEGKHEYDVYADMEEQGKYEWWQLRFVVLFDEKRNRRIDGLLININKSKNYEEELRRAMILAEEAKQKEDFLMTISHEIRTPLNAVVGFSDVVISLPPEQLTPEELKQFGGYINENNQKLAAMIEDILMFSRIESGRLKFVPAEFNIAELVKEVFDEWKNRVPEGIRFLAPNFRNNIYVNYDRTRVKYILNQMVSNAFKFTTKGTVVITPVIHYSDSEVELLVEDTGCGLAPEKHEAAFGLFWKDNEFVPGLGLGLHVAKKLAEGMGARIKVDSSTSFGSQFSLVLKAYLKNEDEEATN